MRSMTAGSNPRREFLKKSLGALGMALAYPKLEGKAWARAETDGSFHPPDRPPLPSPVHVFSEERPEAAVDRALEATGGLDFLKPGQSVLVKPACNSGNPYPATTDPKILAHVVRRLKERGAGRIVVADGAMFLRKTRTCMKENGLKEAAERSGADLAYVEEGSWVRVRTRRASNWALTGSTEGAFYLTALLPQLDHVVVLPTVRTHMLADFTMALKIGVGLTSTGTRLHLHWPAGFRERVAELNLPWKPSLILLDGRRVFTDHGPDSGTEKSPGVFIAGFDPIATDVVGLALLRSLGTTPTVQGQAPWSLPVVHRAVELGLGARSTADLLLKGDAPLLDRLRPLLA